MHFGAVNQVAKAQSNGYAYGASGAVSNSGGVSAGGQNGYPANATIDLSPKAVPTPGTLPLPGAGNLAALGGVSATIGAVSGLASTPAGFTKPGTTDYNIAGLGLSLGSPALGGFLGQLADALEAARRAIAAGACRSRARSSRRPCRPSSWTAAQSRSTRRTGRSASTWPHCSSRPAST